MTEPSVTTPDRLTAIENRLRRLEERIDRKEGREAPVRPWQHLVRRRHPWRNQLYVKLKRRLPHNTSAGRLLLFVVDLAHFV